VKIGIDCQFCGIPTGIGQYTYHLVAGLSRCIPPEMKLTALVGRNRVDAVPASTAKLITFPPSNRVIWANVYAPWVIYREHLDLYHAVDNLSVPLFWPKGKTRYVLTVHDLIPILFPEGVKRHHAYYFRMAIGRLLKLADAVIVDSVYTRDRIAERSHRSADKINVIYPGVDTARFKIFSDRSMTRPVRAQYNIGDAPYLLYVGNIEPRKNVSAIISAYAEVLKTRELKPKPRLVIAGSDSGLCNDVFALPARLGVSQDVSFIGPVSYDDLPLLYADAALFLFPSLHEGFGLPVLEAMACGTPVITSNVTSLPEIAGDAAITVDPTKTGELSDAVACVLSHESFAQKLREKGLERASQFTWAETARRTLQVYERVLNQYGRENHNTPPHREEPRL
jgi:glycosyltransferase involved in cell wall biosynthesis